MIWKMLVDLATAGSAFAGAVFWLKASLVDNETDRFKRLAPGQEHIQPKMSELSEMIKEQGRLNAWAARFSGIAAVFVALSAILGIYVS